MFYQIYSFRTTRDNDPSTPLKLSLTRLPMENKSSNSNSIQYIENKALENCEVE